MLGSWASLLDWEPCEGDHCVPQTVSSARQCLVPSCRAGRLSSLSGEHCGGPRVALIVPLGALVHGSSQAKAGRASGRVGGRRRSGPPTRSSSIAILARRTLGQVADSLDLGAASAELWSALLGDVRPPRSHLRAELAGHLALPVIQHCWAGAMDIMASGRGREKAEVAWSGRRPKLLSGPIWLRPLADRPASS